jgi:hypothetical protein
MGTLQEISKVFGQNKEGTFYYYSEIEFSMHELLDSILCLTGPASVKISSFSISEVAIRTFHRLSEDRLITDLHCIFDQSVKRHRLGLLFFALNISGKVALAKNHAKIILIENSSWKLTVLSSANFNVNDKIEAGIITGCPDIFSFYKEKFESTFNNNIIIYRDDFEPRSVKRG